jgi:hypothetical protein
LDGNGTAGLARHQTRTRRIGSLIDHHPNDVSGPDLRMADPEKAANTAYTAAYILAPAFVTAVTAAPAPSTLRRVTLTMLLA